MSKQKWAAFYAAVVFIDILQIILDFFVVGVAINRAIDVVVAILLPFCLHLCGISMTDPKKLLSVLGAGVLEMFPGVDALPLWTLDLVVIHAMSKGKDVLKKVTPAAVQNVAKITSVANKMRKPLNKNGVRLPRKDTGDEEIAAAFSSRDTI